MRNLHTDENGVSDFLAVWKALRPGRNPASPLFPQETQSRASQLVMMNEIPRYHERWLSQLAPEKARLLEMFVAGRCTDAQCREVGRFLTLHPQWICAVARRVNGRFEEADRFAEASPMLAEAA